MAEKSAVTHESQACDPNHASGWTGQNRPT